MTTIALNDRPFDSADVSASVRRNGIVLPSSATPTLHNDLKDLGSTRATDRFMLWSDLTVLADDPDSPSDSADPEGLVWQVPADFRGYLSVVSYSINLGLGGLPPDTPPGFRLFGQSKDYQGNPLWRILPDSGGNTEVTFTSAGVAIDNLSSSIFAFTSESHLFDLRGSEIIRALPTTATADSVATLIASYLYGRLHTVR